MRNLIAEIYPSRYSSFMKSFILNTLYLPLVFGFFGNTSAQQHNQSQHSVQHLESGVVIIENFEHDTVGDLPHKWYNRDGKRQPFEYPPEEKSTYKYKVQKENGNQYLNYQGTSAKHMNFPIINKDGVNIYETPILSWRWRVNEIPEGANEDEEGKNDAAASIYVVFDMGRVALFKKVPKSIRYTWSSTLKEGTELSKLFGNQQIVVVKSGTDGMGEWHTFQRNILEDYRRLFGDDPPKKPLAILILSDGNSTGQRAEADYDDIELRPMMY